jgi:hypothetical protein
VIWIGSLLLLAFVLRDAAGALVALMAADGAWKPVKRMKSTLGIGLESIPETQHLILTGTRDALLTRQGTRDGSSGADRLRTAPATAGDTAIRSSRARSRTARCDSVSSPTRSTFATTRIRRGPTISNRR